VFITEELEKNGTVDVPNDTGGVDTAVIYSSNMAPLASIRDLNALHSPTILSWGQSRNMGQSQQLALRMYQDMVIADEEFGFRLSALGREGLTSSMTALSNTSRSKVCQKHRLCIEGNDENNLITNKPSMTSLEIPN
jgi:hypothetical protein